MNGHNERHQNIETLRACISQLGKANLRISESPDLETVLSEVLKPLSRIDRRFPTPGVKDVRHMGVPLSDQGGHLRGTCF